MKRSQTHVIDRDPQARELAAVRPISAGMPGGRQHDRNLMVAGRLPEPVELAVASIDLRGSRSSST
jgi:hypothetical protein